MADKTAELLACHFIGNSASGFRLKNDSRQHGNTLTDNEYEAVQCLVDDKPIPKKLLGKDNNENVILKDGILATAEAVAEIKATLG